MSLIQYRVEELGELGLQDSLNAIAGQGYELVSILIHGLVTEGGRPMFVTVWKLIQV